MKKKINLYLLVAVFLTLTATLVMATAVFHHMYREQILDDMRTHAELLGALVSSGEELGERYENDDRTLRVTAIGADGEVLFDSQAGGEPLGNHADRPEVRSAEQDGEGYAVRHSDTLNRDMYYYAIQLENGDVLRISKEEDNIWSVFQRTIRGIVGIGVLMFLVCLALSHGVTGSLVRPIERMAEDIDRADEVKVYEELIPFVTTIRKQHEDILKGARMRQEFTANVSHELKTPLTSISGYAELIETGIAGEKEVQRFAGEIHRNAKRLLTLINDIIRLSELDAQHLETTESFTAVDLYELAASCVESLRVNAETHGVVLTCTGRRAVVRGSREMLEELLYNLCDNAIRYNHPGGKVEIAVGTAAECLRGSWLGRENPAERSLAENKLTESEVSAKKHLSENKLTESKVSAKKHLSENKMAADKRSTENESVERSRRESDQPGGVDDSGADLENTPTLVVRDTGIGIPKESRERVFERFYRVDKSRSKQTGGTGLGLAIVKHIVAQHHAQLTLQSEEGAGTEIYVKFAEEE